MFGQNIENIIFLKHNISIGDLLVETKISKGFQTVVPAEIRKKFNLSPGYILEWVSTEEGVEFKFRKKVTIDDILGMVDGPETDAVELKKKSQMG